MTSATLSQAHAYRVANPPQTGAEYLALMAMIDKLAKLEGGDEMTEPTMKPDYNNGNWWGWSGGECPVHPESVVEYIWHDTNQNRFGSMQMKAGYNENDERPAWPHIIRFRVVTPYVEPAPAETAKPPKRRVWWIAKGQAFSSAREAKTAFPGCEPVKVKECRG